jgi:trk system potassium uptake protein TrkA
MAQIAVIGLSSFGFYLAKRLTELGSEVLAVDNNEPVIDRVKIHVTRAVIADATDARALKELDLHGMDAVVLSLGGSLEAAILAAMHLKELGVRRIVAKALSDDHAKILEVLGVHRIVFPERDMGNRVASSLHGANVEDFLPLGADFSILEMFPLKEMVGKTLPELDFRKRYRCQVLAVKDKVPEEAVFIPEPDTKLKASHVLIVMGKNKDLSRLRKGT